MGKSAAKMSVQFAYFADASKSIRMSHAVITWAHDADESLKGDPNQPEIRVMMKWANDGETDCEADVHLTPKELVVLRSLMSAAFVRVQKEMAVRGDWP